jgi:DNA-binding CsgD family transcriptional regulator
MRVMLEIFGHTAEVGQVYDAMLNARPVTVRELVSATGLTGGAVRAALRQLEARGFVTEVSRSPLTFVATDPTIAMDVLLLNLEEELRRARLRAQEIGERFRQAESGRDPVTVVEIVADKGTILQRIDQVQRSAQRELRYFDKPPYHDEPLQRNQAELDLLRRGGQARSLYETAAVRIPDRLIYLDAHLGAGEQARVLPHLPAKMLLVDDRLAVMSLNQENAGVLTPCFAFVQRSALFDSLSHLFETLWQLALPLDVAGLDDLAPVVADRGTGTAEPDPLERRILGLMNAGLPDEAIARHLGLSHRTLQRRIRGLMQRLHAFTRYQLGAQAVARGWDLSPARLQATPGARHSPQLEGAAPAFPVK